MKATANAVLLFATLIAGCGSGNNAGNNGGEGGVPGGAGVTWKDNGTQQTASFGAATRTKSATLDMLQVVGSNAAGRAAGFVVSSPPPLLPGPYACSDTGVNGRIVTITADEATMFQSCMIDIGAIGETTGTRTTGSFSAPFTLSGGGTKTITDGQFDLMLTVSTL